MQNNKKHPLSNHTVKLWLFLGILLLSQKSITAGDTWDGGHGSPDQACRARVDEGGAYMYSHAEQNGDVAYCYVKPKEGEGDKSHASSVTKDAPVEKAEADTSQENTTSEEKKPESSSPPATSSSTKKDEFVAKCIDEYFSTSFETEINQAYKTTQAGVGGASGGVTEGGNVAVLEWKENNILKKQWFSSGDGHSEEHILAYLKEKSIPREQVTRIFSELSPCLDKCLPSLSSHFAGIRSQVTLEFYWYHNKDKKGGKPYTTCQGSDAQQTRQIYKQARRQKALGK